MTGSHHAPKVLLTGATGHLGRHIARRLATAAAGMALTDLHAGRLGEVARGLDGGDGADGERGGSAPAASGAGAAGDPGAPNEAAPGAVPVITVPADVTGEAAARAAVLEAHERLGGLDVLVNAHGIEGPTAPVTDLDPADVRRTFEVNVLSLFWLCGAAAEILEAAGGGRIVNMASGAGLAGGAFTGVYHASKHAVVGLTRSLARELGPAGIAVNAVCPGFVESPMVDRIVSALGDLDLPTDYRDAVPLGRYADPDEVAEAVRYLACDAPDYLTGTYLVLDGGLRA